MAIITTPGAGVSPYQTSAAAEPTTLTTTVAGRTASVTTATPNTSVYAAGQAALNSLITSGQTGVFQGANINLTLEEQQFVTNNQVTATTNYADGANGSIQYNNGDNGFAGDAYFTYTNSNIITPGIRTDGYFYGNGAPFIGGGNAAIGNFIFTGDNMTIAHANSTLSVTGNGTGNVNINANGNTWTFKSDGNLTLPTAGNIVGAVNIIGNGTGNVNVIANSRAWTFAADGNLVLPLAGNIVNYGNTWNFGYNGILTLPGNSRVAPVGANIELQAAAGGYAEIVTSDGNNYVAVTSSGAKIVTSGINTWNFDNVGNLILPGNTFAVKYANGDPVVISAGGLPLANGTSNIDIATANGNVTITANGSPTWTFNSDGNLTIPGNIVGANVISANAFTNLTGAGNVLIQSSENQTGPIATWTFDPVSDGTGNMIFPTGMHISTDGFGGTRISQNSNGAPVTLRLIAGNANGHAVTGWSEEETPGAGNLAVVSYNLSTNPSNVAIITGNLSATSYTWTFANGGNLTLPNGAVIKDTAGNAVAFGKTAGNTGQGNDAVAIGNGAGFENQGNAAVAIGGSAGANAQGVNSVAIGAAAGARGNAAIAIGVSSGFSNQGNAAVAVGSAAGANTQSDNAVAIGYNAGYDTQGANSVAIGALAGQSAQGNNSIIINATGAALNALTANTFTVAPVRNDVANIANIMFYNATSKEITYGNTVSVTGNITGGNILTGGAVKTGSFVTGTIPTAAGVGAGARAFVTDADSITFGNLYVGGAANAMPVWSNGTSWYIG